MATESMEGASHYNTMDGANGEGHLDKNRNQSECIMSQPTANGTLTHHSAVDAPPPLSDRSEDPDSSDDSLIDSFYQLLPAKSSSALQKQKDVDSSSASPPPVCTPPSSSFTSPASPPSHSASCKRHHHSTIEKRLSSTRSHTSFKTDAAHIKEVAGDDCCAHCLLACLFCEMLSMCSALGECLVCGTAGAGCCDSTAGCCCCMEVAGEAACTEEACQAVLDCGMLEGCCGSSDCLEICLECCSICFPT
ncbi:uncharacterized protein KZ484_014651 isoform 1-T1 [Pholidichthys leucotaenia]